MRIVTSILGQDSLSNLVTDSGNANRYNVVSLPRSLYYHAARWPHHRGVLRQLSAFPGKANVL